MGPEHASREKKLTIVIFLISVQKNVSIIRFQEIKIRPLKGFEKMRFFVFLHYRGIGVFWPKIPLNLTSEGLIYPQEVQVQHETCSTICGTPVQAIFDQKNLTGLAGGVKEGQNMAQNGPRFYIFLASEPSRSP